MEKEGHTASTHWNDGSLCSVGRSDPVLSGPREDNVSESLESARNKKRRAENGQRGGARRRGSDVKWMSARRSAFVRSDRYDYEEGYLDLPVSRFLFDYSSLSGNFYVRCYLRDTLSSEVCDSESSVFKKLIVLFLIKLRKRVYND